MPIDPGFKGKRQKVDTHAGHDVWGPVEPPAKLGIHGSRVAVDFDVCTGDGTCMDVCPVGVFEWFNTPGHPTSSRKADPARESECIYCLACESVCPAQAIKVFSP